MNIIYIYLFFILLRRMLCFQNFKRCPFWSFCKSSLRKTISFNKNHCFFEFFQSFHTSAFFLYFLHFISQNKILRRCYWIICRYVFSILVRIILCFKSFKRSQFWSFCKSNSRKTISFNKNHCFFQSFHIFAFFSLLSSFLCPKTKF